jgi:mRNA-capping enzyme
MCAHFFQQHPDNIIGVHCTHGYNRTGFLIIAFLVEQDDWSVEAAISAFSKSRPPGIYKQHYLEELVSRYNGNMAEVSIPELPEWCLLEGQEVGEREGEEEAGGRDTGSRKRRRELQKENATFAVCMSEVSVVQGPVREEVQRRCQGILNWEGSALLASLWRFVTVSRGVYRSGFPGSQPVSMDKKNLQLIRAKPYRVSWKADGTRLGLSQTASMIMITCSVGISCTSGAKERFSYWTATILCSPALCSPFHPELRRDTWLTLYWMGYVYFSLSYAPFLSVTGAG